jgi:hypothetical protein
VHVVAIALGVALGRRRRASVGRSAVVTIAAAVPFALWRAEIAAHGVVEVHHQIALPSLSAVGPLAARLLAHLVDLRSFGALVAAFAGAGVAPAVRRLLGRPAGTPPVARRAFAIAAAQLVATVGAIAFSPRRVHEFALSGTLFGRLLVQLAPAFALAAGLSIGAALGDDPDGSLAAVEEQ